MASVAASSSRGAAWSDTAALISIWGESDIQEELDEAVRNKVEISHKLKEQGHNKHTEQFRIKIKRLKKEK